MRPGPGLGKRDREKTNVPKVTLDTNLLLEYWKGQDKRDVVLRLVDLAGEGEIDLVVTARIREDVPFPPLANKLRDLPEVNIGETGSVARLDYWVLGRDVLGDSSFDKFGQTVAQIVRDRGEDPPDWRDWDHLHAHNLLQRNVFLTWDRGILSLARDLRAGFGIVVMRPEDYLESIGADERH